MVPLDKEVQEGKFFGIIAYISFLCMIPLLLKKDNAFALYHAKQGLVIFVVEVIGFILSIVPVLRWVSGIAAILCVIVSLWGIFQALKGTCGKIPLVSRFADKIIL